MDDGERSVLATLAYYGALRWPLTAVELTRRLIPPTRFGASDGVPDLGAVVSFLEQLVLAGSVQADSGFYCVGDAPHQIAAHRVHRESQSADMWQRMLRAARWLQAVPYLRMLAASGSLALGSSSAQSDWDVFAVVRARRLYTARLGLLVAAWIQGRLRTKRMRSAPDHFCFNHIITTDGLAIWHRSLFMAHSLAWLVPFYDPYAYAHRLREANGWVAGYVASSSDIYSDRRVLRRSWLLKVLRLAAETILNTPLGDACEYLIRRWMQRRIACEPMTYEKGGRIVASERELEFHPRSFEAVALARYNASLVRLGLSQYAEHDSGLTR